LEGTRSSFRNRRTYFETGGLLSSLFLVGSRHSCLCRGCAFQTTHQVRLAVASANRHNLPYSTDPSLFGSIHAASLRSRGSFVSVQISLQWESPCIISAPDPCYIHACTDAWGICRWWVAKQGDLQSDRIHTGNVSFRLGTSLGQRLEWKGTSSTQNSVVVPGVGRASRQIQGASAHDPGLSSARTGDEVGTGRRLNA